MAAGWCPCLASDLAVLLEFSMGYGVCCRVLVAYPLLATFFLRVAVRGTPTVVGYHKLSQESFIFALSMNTFSMGFPERNAFLELFPGTSGHDQMLKFNRYFVFIS